MTLLNRVRRTVGRHAPNFIRNLRHRLSVRRGIVSYGQEGEDRILASLLFKFHGATLPARGFYVDVGAHDPHRYSNTYFFYKLGWSGLNIDAAPGSMKAFATHRPRDLNVEVGVGTQKGIARFYVFNEPALNTFDRDLALRRAVAPWRIEREVEVDVRPLRDIFAEYVPPNQPIDFMTVDVEGIDLQVLQSNDWSIYRPMIVAVEIFGKSMGEIFDDPVFLYISQKNYKIYSKTVNTCFFVANEAQEYLEI